VILWFGIDEGAKLFLVSVGVFFPIYLNTFHGIRSVDAGLVEMARSYGLSGWQLYRQVILPGALPSILVGLRFSLGLMWVLLIVAETISAQAGIGYLTMNSCRPTWCWWGSSCTRCWASWPTWWPARSKAGACAGTPATSPRLDLNNLKGCAACTVPNSTWRPGARWPR
jgi:hypothetical protein